MSIYDSLNKEQKEAVFHTDGPLLLLAGAGSGKTRVLVHRIAYLIEEAGVNPWNIMAITFTNKAAKEMRERVDNLVGYGSESIWVSTFHSTCVRILRQNIDLLGYDKNFTIYDTDDQKALMKDIYRRFQIDSKQMNEKAALNEISSAKDKYISPDEYIKENQGNYRKGKIGEIYLEYQKQLRANNALDFDDLLVKTVELFEHHPEVLERYQDRFRYIMVDEYQDTNYVQFLFVKMLARKNRNLCVVGDDDQSIYRFRGADIANILNFEGVYPDAVTIKLEQNYRSTKNILAAANGVIANNHGRKAKTLWTDNEEGESISFKQYENDLQEAERVVAEIDRLHQEGVPYSQMAILNRTNAQSRSYEEKFILKNIPYKIIGGTNFYGRKEIKDILAYMKTIGNGKDDVAVRRIINVPKRGIGATSVERVASYGFQRDMGFLDALYSVQDVPSIGAAAKKIELFTLLIDKLREESKTMSLVEWYDRILELTGYTEELKAENTPEAAARLENIEELKNKVALYEETAEHPDLAGLLEEIALVAEIDRFDDEEAVVIMTLHSAKGLEFPYVFMGGMEDGVFPGYMAIGTGDETEMEEERRLCYVGITRAMKRLYLSAAKRRMIRGQTQYNRVSRFIYEIPKELLMEEDLMTSEALDKDRYVMNPIKNIRTSYKKQEFPVMDSVGLNYSEGDRVKHIKFGVGTVQNIVSGGKDYEVTVDFDKVGIKKMFASFAKLKKVD